MTEETTLLTRGAASAEPATAAPAESAPEASTAAPSAPPSADASQDWRPEALRGEKWTEKYKSLEDALKAFGEAQKLLGKRAEGLIPPGPEAKPEEVEAFNAKLRELRGIPTEPEKIAEAYAVKAPEGAPEGYAIDAAFVGAFQQLAFEAGVAPAEFQKLADGYMQMELQAMQAARDAGIRQAKENEETLVKAWREEGQVPGEMFKAANAAVDALGLRDLVDAPANSPAFIKAMAEKVYPLVAEGKLKGGAVASPSAPKMTQQEAMEKDLRRRGSFSFRKVLPRGTHRRIARCLGIVFD